MVTISESVVDYARDVRRVLRREKFRVDVDDSSSTVNRKVREAQLSKYNYILVHSLTRDCVPRSSYTYLKMLFGICDDCSRGQVCATHRVSLCCRLLICHP